jgi:predicted HTH transcriptional regulator
MKIPYPKGIEGVIQKFILDKLVLLDSRGLHISNLGALLFAKNLAVFDTVKRKAVRVVQYNGRNKLKTVKDQLGQKGYVAGFEGLITFINSLLPSNEEIGQAFRDNVYMYPLIAIRELVANAIIHKMTNQSLRTRFKISDENAAIVSRIIKETAQAGLIKEDDPDNKSRKYVRYIPVWAELSFDWMGGKGDGFGLSY